MARAETWAERIARVAGLDAQREASIRPALLVVSALGMSLGGVIWSVFLEAMNAPSALPITLGYPALTLVNLAALRLTGGYVRFRTLQLLLTLLLPFGVQVAMGGFTNSSAVVVWSLLAPLGAVLYTDLREARWWFAAFLGVLLLGAALEPLSSTEGELPHHWRTVFFVMNLLVPTLLAFLLMTYFVSEKDRALDLLADEQQETRRLLLNVLPESVADRLRDAAEDEVIAEQFDSVTVLFADIVGFTQLTNEMSPTDMIACLNEVFSAFDQLASRYGAEKIRTIGDNYMVACGAPLRRDDHAEALVSMALDMLDYLDRSDLKNKGRMKFRIGINSGPVVGGVVGRTKFHYDVWGDAVNVASRMESHGEPGRVQIGDATRALLGDRFALEERGVIEVKGKGTMRTWFVTRDHNSRNRTSSP